MERDPGGISADPVWQDLLPWLQRLDARLEQAVRLAQTGYAPAAAGEQFRGLYTSDADAEALLSHRPGEPLLYAAQGNGAAPSGRLARLQQCFGLAAFDLEVIMVALAPELDRRYERLYAYLQDNVALRRPTVDLALQLLCADAVEKIERRAHFTAGSSLISHGLLHLRPEGDQGSLLAAAIKLDELIAGFLLGQDGLDPRLAPYCRELRGGRPLDELPLPGAVRTALASLAARYCPACLPARLHFHGPEGSAKTEAAAAFAAASGRALLVLDLASAARSGDPAGLIRLLLRAALLGHAVPCLATADALADPVLAAVARQALEDWTGLLILIGEGQHLAGSRDTIDITFGPLGSEERERWWQHRLASRGIALSEEEIGELAGRLQLTAGEVEEAVDRAFWKAQGRAAASCGEALEGCGPAAPVTVADLYEAACEQSSAELATLARRLRPARSWQEIVLPEDTLAQLRELCDRVSGRRRVLERWGFGRRLSLGRGTVALFTGPPGTGKTLAAEIVASELRLDLCKIDLSSVVSKYIGETEKNLSRIFAAAERSNAILFFDEADALFGKRSEVRDSHDRYANIETSYLLQKMEEYDGAAILATNLRQNLDESFIRRISFTIHFPFPDGGSRLDIWRTVWPPETPLAEDVDLDYLARTFKLAGGNIRNIALAAAFLAAAEESEITMAHLLHATRREYQKLGKVLAETELQPAAV